jgi:charged multivesicular body protein 2A
MGQMNRSLNLPQIQKIMNDFERESSTMDMKEEMMSDAVDDAMEGEDEGEGEEVEGDKILREVLDEIGMSMNDAVSALPRTCPKGPTGDDESREADHTAHLRTDRQPVGQ